LGPNACSLPEEAARKEIANQYRIEKTITPKRRKSGRWGKRTDLRSIEFKLSDDFDCQKVSGVIGD
jgi:hypothetical protein